MSSLIVGAALFVCCAYVGFGICDLYKRRSAFFDALIEYLDSLERGISYAKTPLPKLTEDFAADKKGELFMLLRKFAGDIRAGQKTEFKSPIFSAYEKRRVVEMLDSLGKYDTDTQLTELRRYRALFAPTREIAVKKYSTTGKLAAKLGVLVGIAVMLALA